VRDYERALDEHTGAILVVHPSNFRVRGFTAEVELEELAALARRAEVPLVYDLGGGVLEDLATWNLPAEPVVRDELSRGADLVTFSGDKILGGPQAGIIAGKRALVEAIRTHPLMRALRCDKLTYAALEGTLQLYRLRPDVLPDELPVLGMLVEPSEAILARARALAAAIETVGDWQVEVVESRAQAGSGALPLEELSSYAVALTPRRGSVDGLAQELRAAEVAVVGRIERERLLLDVRTIAAGEVDEVVSALRATRA
jgi:L-seryl-tRNA(Ser) seleniumtransferase